MRVSFLLWNLDKRPLQAEVATLAAEHDVTVLILIECEIEPAVIIRELESVGMGGFTFPESPSGTRSDIRLFVRRQTSALRHLEDDANDHLTIRRLFPRTRYATLLVVVHFPSKVNFSNDEQSHLTARLRPRIEELETRYGVGAHFWSATST